MRRHRGGRHDRGRDDGSRAGLEAVDWAAGEAALRDVPLRVVHAIPSWACETEQVRYAEVARWMRQGGETVLAAGVERAHRQQPKLTVETGILPGDPRAALIHEGEARSWTSRTRSAS
ncbi:universal stress protein [Nonomuraea roseola]|uniref:Universal stress protein n=1 Tax=Nonomuraea roseola TaxID=46179 RepID=A0ABV5PVF4_9ACTN